MNCLEQGQDKFTLRPFLSIFASGAECSLKASGSHRDEELFIVASCACLESIVLHRQQTAASVAAREEEE